MDRDQWYKPNLLYNIHWRPPIGSTSAKVEHADTVKPKLVVLTKEFNPSVCTCGEHHERKQYRMEREVVWTELGKMADNDGKYTESRLKKYTHDVESDSDDEEDVDDENEHDTDQEVENDDEEVDNGEESNIKSANDISNTKGAGDIGNIQSADDIGNIESADDIRNTKSADDIRNTKNAIGNIKTTDESEDDIGKTKSANDISNTESAGDIGNTKSADIANTKSADDIGKTKSAKDIINTESEDDIGNTKSADDIDSTERADDISGLISEISTDDTAQLLGSVDESRDPLISVLQQWSNKEDRTNAAEIKVRDEVLNGVFDGTYESEEFGSAFGIMAVFCHSEIHSLAGSLSTKVT